MFIGEKKINPVAMTAINTKTEINITGESIPVNLLVSNPFKPKPNA